MSLQPEVDSRQLRRFVVRVASLRGATLGSGFFTAPGQVATCAHVVGDEVEVVLTNEDLRLTVAATVVARSERRPPGPGTALWPFPDLAVLRFDPPAVGHPVVLLADGDPGSTYDCHAWGYAQQEAGIEPTGAALRLQYQGVDGSGFLSFKSGLVQPGLSGAPLVCPQRREVVGVVNATRGRRAEVGGWATPSAALGAFCDEALGQSAGTTLDVGLRHNLKDRSVWNSVLPVHAPGQRLSADWAEFTRLPRSTPSQMLLAKHMLVPYLFRDEELAAAESWCEGPEPMSLTTVAGGGGTGKTRFAVELCRRQEDKGWAAGFLGATAREASDLPVPRLVVVDYAESAPNLPEDLRQLQASAAPMAPVRVLMLTRTTARYLDPLDALREEARLQRLADESLDIPAASQELTLPQRAELYRQCTFHFARAWKVSATRTLPDLSSPEFAVPLEVAVDALNATLAGPGRDQDAEQSGLGRLLAHEERYWRRTMPRQLDAQATRLLVALMTLAGAANEDEARSLFDVCKQQGWPSPAGGAELRWFHDLYEGPGYLNALRPDRLGETLVVEVLAHQADLGRGLLSGLLALPADTQVVQALETFSRLPKAARAVNEGVVHALLAHLPALVDRAAARCAGGHEPGRADLAVAVAQALVRLVDDDDLRQLAVTRQDDVSSSLDTLTGLIGTNGHSSTAIDLARRMLVMDEHLHQAAPDSPRHTAYLSRSCRRLAEVLCQTGDFGRAQDLFHRAQRLLRALRDQEPQASAHALQLALVLDRLGDLARERDRTLARQYYQEAVTLRDACGTRDPEVQRMRTVSRNRLGDLAYAARQYAEAETLYEWALSRRLTLYRAEPENRSAARAVSVSYERMGDTARQRGDIRAAKSNYEAASHLTALLARTEPDNLLYQRDLATSEERIAGVHLAEDEPELAIAAYTRAVALRERLCAHDTHRLDLAEELADSLHQLGKVADEGERRRLRLRAVEVLREHERAASLTEKGRLVLEWCRTGDDRP